MAVFEDFSPITVRWELCEVSLDTSTRVARMGEISVKENYSLKFQTCPVGILKAIY